MNIVHTLNEKLLAQTFEEDQEKPNQLSQYQFMALMYSRVENAIAVLSDMKANKSYLYHGKVAKELGLEEQGLSEEINTIWEEAIFNKIHPDDLFEKHLLELQFFNIIKNLPIAERSDYHVKSKLRMQNKNGSYVFVIHRMFYVSSAVNGSLWLALCLYNLSSNEATEETPAGIIVNSATGITIKPEQQENHQILSGREKEVLQLIRKGKMSKEMADLLSISINTVNRHRQNILEKLRVNNSHEACRLAERMKII